MANDPENTIHVPEECRVCMCCKDWSGNTLQAMLKRDGIYGGCEAHGNRTLSIATCDKFRADHYKVAQHQECYDLLRVWRK